MKLKEIPGSLRRAYQLNGMSAKQFHQRHPCELDCVVSLTTIESRFSVLHLALRSLLSQSCPPRLIVLWVHHSLLAKLPEKVRCLEGQRFKIMGSDQTCSHRKLVESLKIFPDAVIVTSDDDVMYPHDWLERLWREHLRYPDAVVAHECRRIGYTKEGELLPYIGWKAESPGASSETTMAIGNGGVLYPPGVLHPDVTDRSLYDRLAPKADDIWFKAMSYRLGTAVRKTNAPIPAPVPVLNTQRSALKNFNIKEDGNRLQWLQICDYYGLSPRVVD